MKPSIYQKLPGHGCQWGGLARVWLGPDHLLLVLRRGYYESYRRFFFNDIQGIILQRTATGKVWNLVWGGLFLFFGAIALAVPDKTAAWVFASFAAPFGLALMINLLLGPTCSCYVRTAVQTERLPAVSRMRAAEKFMARVEPLVLGAQGELPREQLTMELALLQSGQMARAAETPPSNVPPVAS